MEQMQIDSETLEIKHKKIIQQQEEQIKSLINTINDNAAKLRMYSNENKELADKLSIALQEIRKYQSSQYTIERKSRELQIQNDNLTEQIRKMTEGRHEPQSTNNFKLLRQLTNIEYKNMAKELFHQWTTEDIIIFKTIAKTYHSNTILNRRLMDVTSNIGMMTYMSDMAMYAALNHPDEYSQTLDIIITIILDPKNQFNMTIVTTLTNYLRKIRAM